MLIHRQSHQEYLNFLHETKVHLDSSQRTRLQIGFGTVREKLRLLNLDPVMGYLSALVILFSFSPLITCHFPFHLPSFREYSQNSPYQYRKPHPSVRCHPCYRI